MNSFEKLNENELKELKGALYALDMMAEEDVINKNIVKDCICSYRNMSAISNLNSFDSCQCVCRP